MTIIKYQKYKLIIIIIINLLCLAMN